MTRYDFFRRRIAPILFLGMVGLIAYDACEKQERTHSTIVLDLGEAAPQVRSIEAELLVKGEVIHTFQRTALPGSGICATVGPCEFEAAMPDEHGELRLVVQVGDRRRELVRSVRALEGGRVTVPLGPDLR